MTKRDVKWPSPYGYTLFCDDARDDANGKAIYTGVYSGGMTVHTKPPTALPKLSVVINYFERCDESSEDVEICMSKPEDETEIGTSILTMSGDELQKAKDRAIEMGDEDVMISSIIRFDIAPFEVVREGYLRVRALRGDEVIRLGSMKITYKPREE